MKITLIRIGKIQLDFAKSGYNEYVKRLQHYVRFEDVEVVVNPKNNDPIKICKAEAEQVLKRIQETDYVVLLDDKGKQFSSEGLAKDIQQKSLHINHLVVIIGGAYGFDPLLVARSRENLSLSAFTFSHQLVPLIFAEQLYRAFTIIKGEPYHHA